MGIDLDAFKPAYEKWVKESLPDYQRGNCKEIIKRYPLLVKFARGSRFGEPRNVKRQRRILLDALEALKTMTKPGTIQELPYQWKKPDPE